MKVLITGANGFVGSHLVDYFLKNNFEVFGTIRNRSNLDNLKLSRNVMELHECELRDYVNVHKVLSLIRPDYLIHTAAQSFVPTSWKSPWDTINNNVKSQINILEAILNLKIDCRMTTFCSSEEYGLVYSNEVPITENNPFRPLSPYGVSKIAQDACAYQYYKSYNIHIIRTRHFNMSGIRRGEQFFDSNFAKQIVMIERGLQEPKIKVGNLEAFRDMLDVRDACSAQLLALERCVPGGDYNICSNKAYKIKDVLDRLISLTIFNNKIHIIYDQERMRPSDVPILLGTYKKFHEITNWEPKYNYLEETLPDLLQYWREIL